jgi:hypothetical protein
MITGMFRYAPDSANGVRRLSLMCLVSVLALPGSGCEETQRAQSLNTLPENERWTVTGAGRQNILFNSAMTFLEKDARHVVESILSDDSAKVVASGNIQVAAQRVGDYKRQLNCSPLVLFGYFGIGGRDEMYITLGVLNLNRETERIQLLLRGPGGSDIRISRELAIRQKELEWGKAVACSAAATSWETLLSRIKSDENGAMVIWLGPDDAVPLPEDVDYRIAGTISDRVYGTGNFVLLSRFDYADSPD